MGRCRQIILSVAHCRTGSLKVCSRRFEGKTKIRKSTSFKLHMKNKNNNKFFLATTKQCLCTTFSLSHYFSLIQKFTTWSNYNDKNNQLKDVKKNNEKICDILNLLDE